MKKSLLILISILLISSCVSTQKNHKPVNIKDELNSAIIEGFYNNDTSGISKDIYFIK